jgi:hypothetical protein
LPLNHRASTDLSLFRNERRIKEREPKEMRRHNRAEKKEKRKVDGQIRN